MGRSRSSKYIYILGEQVAKRTLYLGIASVLIVIGGVGGLLYYLLQQGRAPVEPTTSSAPVESQVEVPVVAAPLTLPEITTVTEVSDVVNQSRDEGSTQSPLVTLLERHLKATKLGELDSLVVNATASSDSVACELTLMARRPNLYKLKTEGIGADYIAQFGYDGKQGWFKGDLASLTPDEIEFFMRVALFESSVAHLAWSYQSPEAQEFGLDAVLEHLPSEQWQGRLCEVVVSRSLLPFPIYHYIDPETYEEVFRRAQIAKGTELVDIEIHFAPSDGTASSRVPMGYELYIAGELHDTVKYTRVRSNRVVLSSLFDASSDASATGLSPRQ